MSADFPWSGPSAASPGTLNAGQTITPLAGQPSAEITYTDDYVPGACVNAFTLNRTWTSTDACGNTTTEIQVITVEDSENPTMSCPAAETAQCDPAES